GARWLGALPLREESRRTAPETYTINRTRVLVHPNGPSIVRRLSDRFRGEMAPGLARPCGLRGFGLGRALLFRYGHPKPLRTLGRDVLPALRIGPQRRATDRPRSDRVRGRPPGRRRPRLEAPAARGG